MKSYFGYIRVSDSKQGNGASLPEQRSAIEAYATRNGLHISGWIEERKTAAKVGRAKFDSMLADLEKGLAAGVIIHKIDRGARHLLDWAHLGDLLDRGIEVHIAHDSLDLNTRSGRLTGDLLAVLAADYLRNLKEEVLKGFDGRLKQGFYPMPAPIGYVDRGGGRAKEHHPSVAPLVREMFELYASGQFSMEELRLEMYGHGLTGKTGKPLSKQGTARILHNPFYIGLIRIIRRGETFQGVHMPLVPKKVFDRVQAISSGRVAPRNFKRTFLFQLLIECAGCGRVLTGEDHGRYTYYRCHTRTCRRVCFSEKFVVENIRAVLSLLAFRPDEMREVRDFGDKAKRIRASDEASRRAQLSQNLGLCEGRLVRLTDAFVDGSIDKDLFESRKEALFAERLDLREALADQKPGGDIDDLMEKFEIGNTAQLQFETLPQREKRALLRSVVSKLVAEEKGLGIVLCVPFMEVVKQRSVLSGGPYGITVRNDTIFLSHAKPVSRHPARLSKTAIEQLIGHLDSPRLHN